MKTQKNILTAFLLNLAFSVFELLGGFLTGSVAILSDSVHDLGDAASIGISYLLERKSGKPADTVYSYGYRRFSVLGGLITTLILAVGSILVIIGSVDRLLHPVEVRYDSMILIAVIGTAVNLVAAFVTREGDSINQQSVNLHMLEDVLGWIVVLIGSVVMRFTDIRLLDPLMSIGVSVFILCHTFGTFHQIGDLFLEKTPDSVNIDELTKCLSEIEGVAEVCRVRVRSIDGTEHAADVHVITECGKEEPRIKNEIRQLLLDNGIPYSSVETDCAG